MTHRNLLIIALKVAALFLILSVIQTVPEELLKIKPSSEVVEGQTVWLIVVLPSVIKILIAALFWFFPGFVISTTVPDSAKSDVSPEYFSNLNSALISGVGVYLACYGITDLVYYWALKEELMRQFSSELQPSDQAGLIATVVQVGIGILLVIGNKGLSKIIFRVRS